MKRRALAATLGLLLVSLLTVAGAGIAGANHTQEDPDNHTSPTFIITTTTTSTSTTTTSTTSTSVLPDEETTTTTTEATTTTTTTEAPEVAGEVITRPLPRTGSDIGGPAIVGAALTITGIALALGARRRRNNFESA